MILCVFQRVTIKGISICNLIEQKIDTTNTSSE